MKKIVFVAFLAGCATTDTVTLPDGSQGVAVTCPGTRRDMSDCMNRAAEVCGGPYEIISQDTSTTGAIAITDSVAAAAVRRSMVVSCE